MKVHVDAQKLLLSRGHGSRSGKIPGGSLNWHSPGIQVRPRKPKSKQAVPAIA